MKDSLVLECTRAALIEYQRRQNVPSESVARVVIQIERELQGIICCPYCGREERS